MMQSSESQSLLSDTGTASGVLIGTQPHFGSYRGFAMPHPTNTTWGIRDRDVDLRPSSSSLSGNVATSSAMSPRNNRLISEARRRQPFSRNTGRDGVYKKDVADMPPQPSFDGLFVTSTSLSNANNTGAASAITSPRAGKRATATVQRIGGGLTASLSPRSLSQTIAQLTRNVPSSSSHGVSITQLEEEIQRVRQLREMMEHNDNNHAQQFLDDIDPNGELQLQPSDIAGASTRVLAPRVPDASPSYSHMVSSLTGTPDIAAAPPMLAAISPYIHSHSGAILSSSLQPAILSGSLSSMISSSAPSLLSSSSMSSSFPLAVKSIVDTDSLQELQQAKEANEQRLAEVELAWQSENGARKESDAAILAETRNVSRYTRQSSLASLSSHHQQLYSDMITSRLPPRARPRSSGRRRATDDDDGDKELTFPPLPPFPDEYTAVLSQPAPNPFAATEVIELYDRAKAARADRDRIEAEREVMRHNDKIRREEQALHNDIHAHDSMTRAAAALIDDQHHRQLIAAMMQPSSSAAASALSPRAAWRSPRARSPAAASSSIPSSSVQTLFFNTIASSTSAPLLPLSSSDTAAPSSLTGESKKMWDDWQREKADRDAQRQRLGVHHKLDASITVPQPFAAASTRHDHTSHARRTLEEYKRQRHDDDNIGRKHVFVARPAPATSSSPRVRPTSNGSNDSKREASPSASSGDPLSFTVHVTNPSSPPAVSAPSSSSSASATTVASSTSTSTAAASSTTSAPARVRPSSVKSSKKSSHKGKSAAVEEPSGPFRARDVPWQTKVALYDNIINEQQAARQQRIDARAKELRAASSLPPRMQAWNDTIGKKQRLQSKTKEPKANDNDTSTATPSPATAATASSSSPSAAATSATAPSAGDKKAPSAGDDSKQGKGSSNGEPDGVSSIIADDGRQYRVAHRTAAGRAKKYNPDADLTFKPRIKHQVPNFRKSQTKFVEELQARRQALTDAMTKTNVQPFQLSESKRVNRNVEPAFEPFQAKRVPVIKQTFDAGDTTADTLRRKKVAATLAARTKAVEAQAAELKAREDEREYMKTKLAPFIKSTDSDRSAAVAQAKKGVAERDRAWAKQLADMRERVKTKPLLVQTDKRDLERIEARRRALLAIKATLDDAKVKDYERFFDKEELDILDLKI